MRDHDLYVVPSAGGPERRLTTDGSQEILNGKLDWVYQEEIYGRGNFRGYWWSPDGSASRSCGSTSARCRGTRSSTT